MGKQLILWEMLTLVRMLESLGIEAYLKEIDNLVMQFGNINATVEDNELICITLNGLPNTWKPFTNSFGTLLHQFPKMTFADLMGHMQAKELQSQMKQMGTTTEEAMMVNSRSPIQCSSNKNRPRQNDHGKVAPTKSANSTHNVNTDNTASQTQASNPPEEHTSTPIGSTPESSHDENSSTDCNDAHNSSTDYNDTSDVLQPDEEASSEPLNVTTASPDPANGTAPIRRSQRARVIPVRLREDYVMSFQPESLDICVIETNEDVDEDISLDEAMMHPGWRLAMKEEFDALFWNNTWDLVPLPKGKRAISTKWIYKAKHELSPTRVRLKA
ncbi:unnamed protein product [Calypogeia fissa]